MQKAANLLRAQIAQKVTGETKCSGTVNVITKNAQNIAAKMNDLAQFTKGQPPLKVNDSSSSNLRLKSFELRTILDARGVFRNCERHQFEWRIFAEVCQTDCGQMC